MYVPSSVYIFEDYFISCYLTIRTKYSNVFFFSVLILQKEVVCTANT